MGAGAPHRPGGRRIHGPAHRLEPVHYPDPFAAPGGQGRGEQPGGGKEKVFSPVLRREDAALQETEDFLTRVYNGSVSLLVSSMTRRQALPQEEIDQLYALLQQLEDQKGAD